MLYVAASVPLEVSSVHAACESPSCQPQAPILRLLNSGANDIPTHLAPRNLEAACSCPACNAINSTTHQSPATLSSRMLQALVVPTIFHCRASLGVDIRA